MDRRRLWKGFEWGVVATLVMSLLMILAMVTGSAPMPKPIPAAIVGKLTGGGWPRPALMATAALLHLGYGGVWGGLLATVVRRVTLSHAVALALFLWLSMQVVVLPFLGWGLFGSSLTIRIAAATLVLHLAYGLTFGLFMDRRVPASSPAGSSGRS